MIWQTLKADDFETDIIEILREKCPELESHLKGLTRDDFSEVYLFFDYIYFLILYFPVKYR